MMDAIYILVRPDIWATARKTHLFYERTLSNEGFIHACEWRQLERVANAYFQDADELVLVAVLPQKVRPPIRWEVSASIGDVYPHIYGPLNLDAAREVEIIQRGPNGRFNVPATEPVLQR